MFPLLAEAIEALAPPSDNASLSEVLGLRDRLDAKVAVGVADFDAAGLWDFDHASSATAWLRQQGMGASAAAMLVRTGRCVRNAPAVAQAWLDGRLSGGQVQAVVANVSDRVAPLFAEHHAELVAALVGLSVRETAIAMQTWRAKADAILDADDQPPEPERSLHLSCTFGGQAVLKGSLDPATAAPVEAALRVATTDDDELTGERTPAERRADALADICRFFLDHQTGTSAAGRHRPHVNIVVPLDDLDHGRTLDGVLLDADAVRVLLCDSNIHRVVTDGASTILDYGRATRTAPPPLFTALAMRDGHCRLVPGCDRRPEWCDAHHVVAWEDGGESKLDNMVLGCSHHHHLLHRRHWAQRLDADGSFSVTTPDGRRWTTHGQGALPLSVHLAS